MAPIVYLPGAGGSAAFWKPVADLLADVGTPVCLGWPGFGDEPADPLVHSLSDLIGWTLSRMPAFASDLVAQSMGGVVATRIALEHPARVRRLVLCATSGGVEAASLGQEDWRPSYRAAFPDVPDWFVVDRTDLTLRLPTLVAATLVVHGDRDPLCPVSLARFLVDAIPGARYASIAGGDHLVARARPEELAFILREHLTASS